MCALISLGKMTILSKLTSPSHPLNVRPKVSPNKVGLPPSLPLLNLAANGSRPLMTPLFAALAHKAQDIAIHCSHISSMNTALYLLSRGPWIPTHVSIHVRQAALAAVGVGWSWVHQVPTVFPFTCFDACLSLANTEHHSPQRHYTK